MFQWFLRCYQFSFINGTVNVLYSQNGVLEIQLGFLIMLIMLSQFFLYIYY